MNEYGEAMCRAAKDGHIEVVRVLISVVGEDECQEAMVEAAKYGHKDIVEMLLECGTEVTDEALSKAVWEGDEEIVALLLTKYKVVADKAACSILSGAVSNGYVAIVNLLLDAGVGVNAQRGAALSMAAWRKDREVVKVLLERGADPNANFGKAMSQAAHMGDDVSLKMMLEHGGKPSECVGLCYDDLRRGPNLSEKVIALLEEAKRFFKLSQVT